MFSRIVLILSILLASSHTVQAEEEKASMAVGFTAGWVVANGLSLRKYFGNGFVQGTFAGFVDKEVGKEYVDASVSFGYYLNHRKIDRFGTLGIKLVGGVEGEHQKPARNDQDNPDSQSDYLWTGLGLGVDLGNPGREGFLVSLDAIYNAGFKGKDLVFTKLGILPSAGIHYNF